MSISTNQLREIAGHEYGLHTVEGQELWNAADMLDRLQQFDTRAYADAAIAVTALALSAFNRRQAQRMATMTVSPLADPARQV